MTHIPRTIYSLWSAADQILRSDWSRVPQAKKTRGEKKKLGKGGGRLNLHGFFLHLNLVGDGFYFIFLFDSAISSRRSLLLLMFMVYGMSGVRDEKELRVWPPPPENIEITNIRAIIIPYPCSACIYYIFLCLSQ